MKVILLENIKKLGTIGQKVNVKDGFGRNYLLKKGKALLPTKENIAHFETKKAEIIKKNEIEKNKAIEISEKLKAVKITVRKEIMENGNLYGSVTIKEICSEIINSSKVEIKPVERAPDRFGENPFKPKVNLIEKHHNFHFVEKSFTSTKR